MINPDDLATDSAFECPICHEAQAVVLGGVVCYQLHAFRSPSLRGGEPCTEPMEESVAPPPPPQRQVEPRSLNSHGYGPSDIVWTIPP